jgi:hypothetical protein
MDLFLTLLLSLVAAVVAGAVGVVGLFFVTAYLGLGLDLGWALTELGGIAIGIGAFIFSFRKIWK